MPGPLNNPGPVFDPGPYSDPGGISTDVNFVPPHEYEFPGKTPPPIPIPPDISFEVGKVDPPPKDDGTKRPLRFFERPGLGEFPKFKFEEYMSEIKDKLGDKIPFDLFDELKGGTAQEWNWKWKIDFTVLDVHCGPYDIDFKKYFDDYKNTQIASWIRALILFWIVAVFVLVMIDEIANIG